MSDNVNNADLKNEIEELVKQRDNQLIKTENSILSENQTVSYAISQVEGRIVGKAVNKVNDEKIIEKHSKKLANISDRAIEAETERQELIVEDKKSKNKVERQQIRNRLIELKTKTKRLKREQKQVLKEQKADHKKRNSDAKWEIYKDKLQKMKYTYVPNPFILKMLLFFDGMKSFFDGIGAVSTAFMKALKWIFIIGGIVGVLLLVPVTREWLFGLLKIN